MQETGYSIKNMVVVLLVSFSKALRTRYAMWAAGILSTLINLWIVCWIPSHKWFLMAEWYGLPYILTALVLVVAPIVICAIIQSKFKRIDDE